jgi:chromosome segregation ATPase
VSYFLTLADLLRPVVSLDYDDILSLSAAVVIALVGAVAWRKSRSETKSSSEVVDGGVLAQFMELTNKVLKLQDEVAALRNQYGEAVKELGEMRKLEEYLRSESKKKDEIIEDLRGRVRHLEDVCRRAGINGDDG